MITVTYSGTFGFSVANAKLEEILGLEPGGLVRNGGLVIMDLADDCRTLMADRIDLKNEAAIRKAFAASPSHESHREFPRYVDALVLVAGSFEMSVDTVDAIEDDGKETSFRERMKTWGGDRVEVGSVDELGKKILTPIEGGGSTTGSSFIITPEYAHDEDHVWDEDAKGKTPEGVWISSCGDWRTVPDD